MRYHTTHVFSPHIQETPEGYLVCPSVPIARTGVQEYLPEDFGDDPPVEPGPDGVILVVRTEEEVFAPATIASFEGKSVTLLHPEPAPDPDVPDVNPDNWRNLTCGVAMNVRRGPGLPGGTGGQADLLLADLLITDAEAIDAVKSRELRELSCGYDAQYEEIRPGVGRQINIVGNHIALVPRGRAGARVAIRDDISGNKENHMNKPATGKKKTGGAASAGFWDRFSGYLKKGKTADQAARAAARDEDTAKDEETEKQEQRPATDNDDALFALTAKVEEMGLMLRTLVEEKAGAADTGPDRTGDTDPENTGDEDPDGTADSDPERTEDEDPEEEHPGSAKMGDARRTRVADAAAVRRAKAISSGISVQVGDSLEATQKFALRRACRDASLKGAVDGFLSGRTIDGLSLPELNAVFCATAELARHVNNRKTADGITRASGAGAGRASVRDFGKPVTPADINAINNKFYDKKVD